MTGCVEKWTRGRFSTSSRLGCGTPSMGRLGRPPLEVLVSVIRTISFGFRTIHNTFYQSCRESVEYSTNPVRDIIGNEHLAVKLPAQTSNRSCARHAGLCYTSFMVVGVSRITLHLPGCHSLKDKRQVVKSIMSLQLEAMPQQSPPASAYILGVRVDRLSQQQGLDRIEQMIALRRASCKNLPYQQVITVNTEFVMEAQQNAQFRHVINSAALVIADGIGVVWATHFVDSPAPERITGTDTLVALARCCAERGYRLYLLGAAPGVAEQAALRLQALAPGLEVAVTYAGSPAVAEEDAIIERIRTADADVLCVAYGAPAQELWIYRNLSRLPVAVAMGGGGAYNFLSGRQRRAPAAVQRIGLEWLYRLYREPWRWQRMVAVARFTLLVLVSERKKHG